LAYLLFSRSVVFPSSKQNIKETNHMDRNVISLIGIVDTLKHVLETNPAAQKAKELRGAAQRLENTRRELLAEGLRYGKLIGAARDYISETSAQLRGHLTEQRDVQWVLHGLECAITDEVDPPLPPASSSSSVGPGGLAPDLTELARILLTIAPAGVELAANDTDLTGFRKLAGARKTNAKVIR
jgi:hypothetical protein